MGYQPRPGIVRATRYQVLRRLYMEDVIELDEFEVRVGKLLAMGREGEPCPPRAPGIDPRTTWWPVPAVNEPARPEPDATEVVAK